MATRGSGRGGRETRRPATTRPSRGSARPATRPASAPTGRPGSGSGSGAGTAEGWRGRLQQARSSGRAWRALVLGSVLVILAVLLGSTLAAYVKQSSQISSMREQVAQQERDVAELQQEQERWRDPAYVEQQARQRLKFVKPGERSYTVIDGRAPAAALGPAARERSQVPWYGQVWDSMQVADVPSQRQ